MISFLHILTKDHLKLQGVHFAPEQKSDTCMLFVHGMGGNFVDYYFAEVLGKSLCEKGTGFVFFHNRGFNQKNDIITDQKTPDGSYVSVRGGAMYEKFPECLIDIDAWIEELKRLGYTKIILAGHSLGVKKVIYWNYKRQAERLTGIILLSPPDLYGLIKKIGQEPLIKVLTKEAHECIEQGKPQQILSITLLNKYTFSAQTFLSHFQDKEEVNSLPIFDNPVHFIQLEAVTVPTLAVMGNQDFVAIKSASEDLELLKLKATNCPKFATKVITGANHMYHWQEEVLAQEIAEWVIGNGEK